MNQLPGALGVTSTFPFVGRSAELERLRALLPRADGEERRIVLLGGEAGSGKSRLAREFAAEAAGEGVLVLHGAADAVVRTPYGPFVEALEPLVRDEPRAGALARLLPDLDARVHASGHDPDTERHRLHTAVAELLARVTRRRRRRCWCSRTATGPMPPRCCCCGTSPVRAGHACCCWRRSATPMPTSPPRWPRRWPTCAATTSCGCGCPGSRATRWPSSCAERAAPRPPGSRMRCTRSPGGNAFLLCELWRALIETGAIELRRRRAARASPARGAREPGERARGRQPAPRAAGPGDDGPARAGGDRRDGVRARRRPPRRRAR